MVLAGASKENGLHGVRSPEVPSVSPPGVNCSKPGVSCPGGQKDEARPYRETAEKLASENQDLAKAWERTREVMDSSIKENLQDLVYNIARERVMERIANMGGGSIIGASGSEQGGDRGRSRTRESISAGPPPSVGGDISRLLADYERSVGRLGSIGETEPSASGTIVRGEDAPVLTGFDLMAALASRDIGNVKNRLCEVHDLAAEQETTLDDLYEEMTRMMDNNHRLALKLIDREKELEMVNEALVLATKGGLVGDAPSVSAFASAAYLSSSFSASDPPPLELVSTGMIPPPHPRPSRLKYCRRYSGIDFDVLVEDRAAGNIRGADEALGRKAFDRKQRGVPPATVNSGEDQDEARPYREAVEKLASESEDLAKDWERTDLVYNIARERVVERIANMGGGSIIGASWYEQGGDRGRSRTRESIPAGPPPSVRGDISQLLADYERSVGRLGSVGEIKPSAPGTVPASGTIFRGEDAPVLTGSDLAFALASQNIVTVKHRLCKVHDLAAEQEATLDDLYEEMMRMMDTTHRLALKLIDREKELEMVKEALILATEGGLVSDAPSSWSGDDLMPPVRVQIAEGKRQVNVCIFDVGGGDEHDHRAQRLPVPVDFLRRHAEAQEARD